MAVEEHKPLLQVEVVYASVNRSYSVSLQVTPGTTTSQAIEQSGILKECPEIDLAKNKVGVYSKLRELDALLNDNDRVEIYRPLLVDPKEARRRRAAVKKTQKENK